MALTRQSIPAGTVLAAASSPPTLAPGRRTLLAAELSWPASPAPFTAIADSVSVPSLPGSAGAAPLTASTAMLSRSAVGSGTAAASAPGGGGGMAAVGSASTGMASRPSGVQKHKNRASKQD